MHRFLLWAYACVTVLYCLTVLLGWSPGFQTFLAVAQIPLLGAYFWLCTDETHVLQSRLFLLALAVATVCDLLAEWYRFDPILYVGIMNVRAVEISLLAVVLFIETNAPRNTSFLRAAPWVLFWLLALAAIAGWILGDALRVYQVPIGLQFFSLTLLNLAALSWLKTATEDGFTWVLAGVVMIDAMNTIIAVERFAIPIPYAQAFIQLTYALAHYWLVKGFLLQRNNKTKAVVEL